MMVLLATCTSVAQREPPADSALPGGPRTKRPNVVIILTDDQGYGDFSAHGNPILKTPHLDRLCSESVRLTDFHAAPMCTPTRGQLLTGRDALVNGAANVFDGRTFIRPEIPTMAEIFRSNGYRTGIFGKWHLGWNYPHRPEDRGFDETLSFPGSYVGSAQDYWNNDYFDDYFRRNGRLTQYPGYVTDVFFAEAIAWMAERTKRNEPFFTYIPLNAPHEPHFVPPRYREPYQGENPSIASFFGMIANIDENIGKLDAFLRESGLYRDTIVVFLTDNGGQTGVRVFNAGMRGTKGTLYEGGHRVPCFIRWPAGSFGAARDIDELTEVQDLLPTMIDLLGLTTPPGTRFDGVSLAPLLRKTAAHLPDRKLVVQYSHYLRPLPTKWDAAVMWRKWRLIKGQELYDVATDPGQQHNVAARHPEVVAEMRSHYDRWWAQVQPRIDEPIRIVVGSNAENPSILSSLDWWNVFMAMSHQVRAGERRNGAWRLSVDRAGRYEIALCRWPLEANAAIASGVPPYRAVDGKFIAGVALPIARARLVVGQTDQTISVAPGDKAAVFTADLAHGPTDLQTWFYDEEGNEVCGAYYVHVKRL
jgi:arylsulfatase